MKQPSKGFVMVASKRVAFYYSACNLMECIKDYMPDANVTLFCSPEFKDHRCKDFDNVFDVKNPDFLREKLYGMANSPYDITFYMDCDGEVVHEDIATVFDQLEDCDMKFVVLKDDPISLKSFVEKDFQCDGVIETMKLCGGVCLYDRRNSLVRDFMQDWYDMFWIQEYKETIDESKHWWKGHNIKDSMLRWDQFTLWWLVNKVPKYKDLKIGEFDDNYRWNWFTSFKRNEKGEYNLVKKHPIFIHHSSSMNKGFDEFKTEVKL